MIQFLYRGCIEPKSMQKIMYRIDGCPSNWLGTREPRDMENAKLVSTKMNLYFGIKEDLMTMFIKYALIFCLIVAAVLLVFYTYNENETILAAKNTSAPAHAKHPNIRSVGLKANDDITAVILLLPKSFLPALRRFSQSRMAKGIKVLPAQIQLEDGKMIAVTKDPNGNQGEGSIVAGDNSPEKVTNSGAVSMLKKKDRIAAISFLYLLANVHKSRLYR
jgi:hypothetical protein